MFQFQWKAAAVIGGILCFVWGVMLFARMPHPLRSGLREMLLGELALLAVAVSGIWTGVSLPLSPAAAGVAAVAGVPGIIALLLSRLILPL